MNKPVRDVLAEIDNLLHKDNDDSRALWDILSALRGPDSLGDDDLKVSTTAIIRSAALPKTAKTAHSNCLPISFGLGDSEEFAGVRIRMSFSHFRHHAYSAFVGLGLDWHHVNSPKVIATSTKEIRKKRVKA